MKRPHVVIIGGGFGGLSAARALRSANADVTVLDRTNHHLFQPLLYQVATAGLSASDITAPIRHILRKQQNTRVVLAEVLDIDPAGKTVTIDAPDSTISYDYLIVAPGSRHAYFGHSEWEELAPGLKAIEDAAEIRRRFLLSFERAEKSVDPVEQQAYMTFVVVGGGPTGVELSGAGTSTRE
jgi:NADH dehydrogenase